VVAFPHCFVGMHSLPFFPASGFFFVTLPHDCFLIRNNIPKGCKRCGTTPTLSSVSSRGGLNIHAYFPTLKKHPLTEREAISRNRWGPFFSPFFSSPSPQRSPTMTGWSGLPNIHLQIAVGIINLPILLYQESIYPSLNPRSLFWPLLFPPLSTLPLKFGVVVKVELKRTYFHRIAARGFFFLFTSSAAGDMRIGLFID